jgi:plastocyanin
MRETRVAGTDDDRDLDRRNFLKCMAWVGTGDDIPHNVVSTGHAFKSPVLDTDEQFSYRFDMPGSYQYFCSLHPKMTGRVVVG